MQIYCKNNSHVVQSVGHILRNSSHDLPWIMTIHPEKSGGLLCYRCNKFRVGRLRRTEVGLLRAVIAYLDKDYTGWIVPPKPKKKRRAKRNKRRILLRGG